MILSQKHILCVKKVFWDGLEVVWGGLEVVWGVLGWFGVFPRTAIRTHITCVFPWERGPDHLFLMNISPQ